MSVSESVITRVEVEEGRVPDVVNPGDPINGKPCPHCGGSLDVRNPTGLCDHLYYPDSCQTCQEIEKLKRLQAELGFRVPSKVAAIGSDGKNLVVWGIGDDAKSAEEDAQHWLIESGTSDYWDTLAFVPVTDEQVDRIEGGEIDCATLGIGRSP